MVRVDEKGRIVLPKEVRERLGITPGTEVEIHADDGKAIVESETDPERIITRMEELIEDAAAAREESPDGEIHPIARKHVETIRRGAGRTDRTDE